MSIAAHTERVSWRERRPFRHDARSLYWGVSCTVLAFLALMVASEFDELVASLPLLLAWTPVTLAVNLLPVSTGRPANLVADVPLLVAGAMVLSPTAISLVALVGSFDLAELRGRIRFAKSLYNHSQVAIASFLSSAVVHSVAWRPQDSSLLLPLAFIPLVVTAAVSGGLVAVALVLERRAPIKAVVRALRVGSTRDFLLAFVAWGALGATLTALYSKIGAWALLAFLAPTFVTRQALATSQRYIETSEAYAQRERAIAGLANQIQAERLDERRMIAADLHDDVLQPLFKVTIMAHVLKNDLGSGRLLDMDRDLPELLSAAEIASSTLRDLIGDLRRSGATGLRLSEAVANLLRRYSRDTTCRVEGELADIEASHTIQLTAYQIAKEALANSVSHSRASHIGVKLSQEQGNIVLSVFDDGIGFEPTVERQGHYGIAIMRERAFAVGGQLFIDAAPGAGCRVTCLLPTRERHPSRRAPS